MANDFRGLLLDLQISGQIIGIEWQDGEVSHGTIVKVGTDYLIFQNLSMSTGGVISMPAVPLHEIRSVNLRPVYHDMAMPADGEAVTANG